MIARIMSPRPFLAASLAVAAVTVIVPAAPGSVGSGPLAVVIALGCVAAGAAAAIAPRSPKVLGLAGLAMLGMSFGLAGIAWDSAALLLGILAVLGVGAAGVLCLPQAAQRAVVSLLIILHFGGILTAVTSTPPAPWLASQLWVYFYRPYLDFMYLDNSYHFYSPEPGPTTLLWFCIEYEPDADGQNWRWVKVPNFDKQGRPIRPDGSPLWPNIEYIRHLSLAECAGLSSEASTVDQAREDRRLRAVATNHIPLHPDLDIETQFQPPDASVKMWLSSCARHVAHTYHHPTKPGLRVTGIKIYRVIHGTMEPQDVVRGRSPDDPTLYTPYYLGDYDKNGNLKPYAGVGHSKRQPDPLRYWLIPIIREPAQAAGEDDQAAETQAIKNYVYVHAGVPDQGELP